MGNAEIFILIGGNESGPWTLGEVQAFWRAGAVTLETLYAQPDAAEWKPLAAIPDFTSTPQSKIFYADEQRKMIETVVNVMLPVDATKLRQWLSDKLLALDFYPMTDTARESFRDFRAHFSGDEQRQAFGEENLKAYCRREISATQLIGKTDTLIALQQFRASRPLLDYDAEKFKEARHKADEAAGQKTLEHPSRPTLDAYTAEVMRKAVENREWRNAVSAEANAKRDRNLDDEMQAIKIYKQNITRRELGLPELEGGWK